MKNKKLFAILTLVCFMFTLMPVAAFAADDVTATLSANSAKTTGKITVTLTNAATSTSYYVYALDSNDELYTDLIAANEYRGVAPISSTLDIQFPDADTYEVFVVSCNEGKALDKILDGTTYASLNDYVAALKDANEVEFTNNKTTVKVTADKKAYTISFTGDAIDTNGTLNIKADNGFSNEGEVTVAVANSESNTPVKNQAVTFSTNSGYVTVEKVDSYTDNKGKMDIKVSATKAGDYKVYAKYAGVTETLNVSVSATDVAGVTVVAEPKTPVALDETLSSYVGIAFKFVDGNGTTLGKDELGSIISANDSAIKVTVIDAPADSDLLGERVGLRYDDSTNNAWTLLSSETFDEEGTYTFKVALKNGASATASVVAKEFGEPVSMKLTYNQDTVGLAGKATVKAVTLLDANYTAKTIYASGRPDNQKFTSGYENTLEFVANGKAVKKCDSAIGAIETYSSNEVDADKVVGTTITAMVIYDEEELTATAELEVVNSAAELKYVDTTADIAVNNDLEVIVVDENGKKVDVDLTDAELKVYVLSAPSNAVYSAFGDVDEANNELSVDFTASATGEYKLQTVLTYGTDGDKYLSAVETITVGGKVSNFDRVVVMSIGSANVIVNNEVAVIDAAPIIKDGRTFVPFRALAEAFGATVAYDEATNSVTAELNGVKVVMTIGSTTYTVDGVEKTADVAPFINGSRTMVPVRFVAEAFGITVTPLYAADGSVADVLFAK